MLTIGGLPVQSVVIIAGGDSTRMGQAKALLPFHRRPLIDWHVEEANSLFKPCQLEQSVLVCSHKYDYDAYINSSYSYVSDKTDQADNAVGPLGGIAGAMGHILTPQEAKSQKESWLMVLSVDSLIGANSLFDFLNSQFDFPLHQSNRGTDIIVLESKTRTYPLLGLYRLSLYKTLEAYIEQGGRRVMAFLKQQNIKLVEMPSEWEALVNINTPDDLIVLDTL